MGSKLITRSDPKEGIIMSYMIGDEHIKRKCVTCKEIKSEPAEWWELVSWSCQLCEQAVVFGKDDFVSHFEEGKEPF
jgi:hypothetical protein